MQEIQSKNYGRSLVAALLKHGVVKERGDDERKATVWEQTGGIENWSIVISHELKKLLENSNFQTLYTANRARTQENGEVRYLERDGIAIDLVDRGFHCLIVTYVSEEEVQAAQDYIRSNWTGFSEGWIVTKKDLNEEELGKLQEKITVFSWGYRVPAENFLILTVPSVSVTEDNKLAHHGLWGTKRKSSRSNRIQALPEEQEADAKIPF